MIEPTWPEGAPTWQELVADTVRTCEVAAALGHDAIFRGPGPKALGQLLNEMAYRLDLHYAAQRRRWWRRVLHRVKILGASFTMGAP